MVLKSQIRLSTNPLGLAKGTVLDLTIEIVDEYATWDSSNWKFTKDLSKTADSGEIAKYNPNTHKTIVKYPGMSQQEISEKIAKDLAKFKGD